MTPILAEQSGAYVEQFLLPPTNSGSLDGLRFAVKDLIDIAGYRTSGGNPTWLNTHPTAAVNAVCVEQLLAAGATCTGKTITDEMAFSLLGENHFYGTPLNAAAPARVPGGSSSGSASVVSCGLVDFAIGTDSGGSVRVPASNCGIWGIRPTHGHISAAGVIPLSPSYDTVGVLAPTAHLLCLAASVLLGFEHPSAAAAPNCIYMVREAFEYAVPEAREALRPAIERVQGNFAARVCETSLRELCDHSAAGEMTMWRECYLQIMAAEVASCHGAWIEHSQPEFGPMATAGFDFVKSLDRSKLSEVIARREHFCRRLHRALGPRDLLCLPTVPTIAPLKGESARERRGTYYQRTLSLTAIAGVGRLPQVSMPLATLNDAPLGLSFIGAWGEDSFLLEIAVQLENLIV